MFWIMVTSANIRDVKECDSAHNKVESVGRMLSRLESKMTFLKEASMFGNAIISDDKKTIEMIKAKKIMWKFIW